MSLQLIFKFLILWFLCTGSNVSAYVGMVNDVLRNAIPKAVVHCQVREAKRSLLDTFYTQVGKVEVGGIVGSALCNIYVIAENHLDFD